MRLFTDRDLEIYVADSIKAALERQQENHDWAVRRLTARAEDAERERNKFRVAYKNAIKRLKTLRRQLSKARVNLQAAGLGEQGAKEDGTPELDTVQAVLDAAQSTIPGMDSMAVAQVRAYIERNFRARGPKAGGEILEEVLAGGLET